MKGQENRNSPQAVSHGSHEKSTSGFDKTAVLVLYYLMLLDTYEWTCWKEGSIETKRLTVMEATRSATALLWVLLISIETAKIVI